MTRLGVASRAPAGPERAERKNASPWRNARATTPFVMGMLPSVPGAESDVTTVNRRRRESAR
jgi:hypothetical protein